MEVGLVGLPRVGKTSLFNALTGDRVDPFSEKVHLGVASIPDPNVEFVGQCYRAGKIVHATLRLVDIPGVPAGAEAKRVNQAMEKIRTVEAVCHVVRCFDDGSGAIDPAGDIDQMVTELVLADLIVAEGGREKAQKPARAGDQGAQARLALLERVIPVLEEGRTIRSAGVYSEAERLILKNYGFVSAKPVLYVANVGEDDLAGASDHARAVGQYAESTASQFVAVCAQLEAELAELESNDRAEMLDSLGLAEPAVGPVARAANALLGLGTFYTASEKEARAWAFPTGATAPEAAGEVHSDMERGFIRAECIHIEDLRRYGTEKAAREAGKLRSEGKHYVMQDGDVVRFLFNV